MKYLINFFNFIKQKKQIGILSIVTITLLFIFTIGYSLSIFIGNNKNIANIKVNDLSFNITTNSDESSDRILYLKAGNTKLFNVIITNLNKIDTKYELIYKVCTDSKCNSFLDILPDGVNINFVSSKMDNTFGTLPTSSSSEINIISENNTTTDYYILLDLQADYTWNDLSLINQFSNTSIIAYVDGMAMSKFPDSCNYNAEIKGYKSNSQISFKELNITCTNNEWRISYIGVPDKIIVKFKKKN